MYDTLPDIVHQAAGYLFLETFSNPHGQAADLLDARSKLCRPDKEGQSEASES